MRNNRLNTISPVSRVNETRAIILYRILFFIPVLNALADATIYYFFEPSGSGINIGIIRGFLIIIYLAFFGISRIKGHVINKIILSLVVYMFLLTLVSSNFQTSFFGGYIKWFVAFMMFPVGYYMIRDYHSFSRLLLFFVIGSFIVCLNLTVAQVTRIGISAYLDDSFYMGGAGVGITNQLALVLLFFPILFRVRKSYNKKEKALIIITGILSIIYVVLAMKRAGLIGLAGGSLILLYFTRNRRRVLKYIIIAGILLMVTFPIYDDILIDRYEARVQQNEDLRAEGRYMEFFYVLNELRNGSVWQKLFGQEAFNTAQFFGLKYFNRPRMIHGDISSFLYGTGLVGITLYLSIYYMIVAKGVRFLKKYKKVTLNREIAAVLLSLSFATFIISVTGSGTIGERSIFYLFAGAAIGVLTFNKSNRYSNGSIPPDIRKEEGF